MKTIEEYFESQDFSLEDKESLTAEEKAFLENFFCRRYSQRGSGQKDLT